MFMLEIEESALLLVSVNNYELNIKCYALINNFILKSTNCTHLFPSLMQLSLQLFLKLK
jgi:hypothetical protein